MAIINFLVIAFVVFMLVRSLNKMKKAEEPAPAPAPAGPTQEELLADILVALKK
jgi:large conductance mechanosensitive channel